MKKLLIPILFAFAIILQSNSCKKNNTTPLYNTEFPNNTGTWWKYKMYDYLLASLDTVTVTIVGDTKLSDGTDVKIWKRDYKFGSSATDTIFVSNKSDGIRMYNSLGVFKKYVFPLAVGNYWTTRSVPDTNRVVLKGDTSIIAGVFNGAYKITRDSRIPYGQFIWEQEWYAPNIGMIFRNYNEVNGGPTENRVWELVSYSIK